MVPEYPATQMIGLRLAGVGNPAHNPALGILHADLVIGVVLLEKAQPAAKTAYVVAHQQPMRGKDPGLNFRRNEFAGTLKEKERRMNTKAPISGIPAEIMAQLQAAVDKAARGIRDPDEMHRACEDMDRIREGIRKREGILDIGVPAIRQLRDA